jgi:hypothetical protein
MNLRQAAEQALEALQDTCDHLPARSGVEREVDDAITALQVALAQPEQYDQTALELCEKCGWKAIIPDEGCLVCARNEQEPVMWSIFDGKYHDVFDTKYDVDKIIKFKKGKVVVKPLYTAPPKKEWVGLTKEDFYKKDDETVFVLGMKFAEARLKEKNT